MSDTQRLLRIALTIAGALTLIIMLETGANLLLFPLAPNALTTFSIAEARAVANTLSSNFNQLLAIIFTTVAIAVPLTANMYSVKFLDLFIHDRVTQIVLGLFVFAVPHNTWLIHSLKDNYVPLFSLYISLGLVVIYPAILIAYLYYLFRFLHPNELLQRVEKEILEEIAAAQKHPQRASVHAKATAQLVEHIASIAIRSVDRSDRATANESVAALKDVLRKYWQVKAKMPRTWFKADKRVLPNFSREMVLEISESRHWMEAKIFAQIREVLSSAAPRMHDVTSAIAEAIAELGLEAQTQNDPAIIELIVEYFNTFIRLTINRRDARSVFTLFNQYRQFTASLCTTQPDLVLEVAFYFEYYAQAARDQQLPFVVEAIAHDLGTLVRVAWENQMPKWEKVLERFILFDRAVQDQPLLGVKKAQVILAGFFLLQNMPEQMQQIGMVLKGLDRKLVDRMKDDLLHVRREKYWEFVERRTHIDYVPPRHRQKIEEVFEILKM